MTWALFQRACRLFVLSNLLTLDLRKKLGVTIQHLIGSNMEPLLLGCGDSMKVRPKVAKIVPKIA